MAFETFGDILLAWFPLYYEIKTVFVLYLVLPFTQGSSIIYRKIVHPQLTNKEKDIDQYIERAAESSCSALMHFGAKGLTYVANTAITTAMRSQDLIINHLAQRSLSFDDIRPLVRQKLSGNTTDAYQSSKQYQANRTNRTRHENAAPLDNVKELTDEEPMETNDAGPVTRQRKSTSDVGRLKHSNTMTSGGVRRSKRRPGISVPSTLSSQSSPTNSP
nr:receptor expression enhancing protein 2 [Hymenolepis microstoma]